MTKTLLELSSPPTPTPTAAAGRRAIRMRPSAHSNGFGGAVFFTHTDTAPTVP